MVGSKGIGRFSADRLGQELKITTKKTGEQNYHQLEVDWAKFDKDLATLFEKIGVNYFSSQSKHKLELSYTKIEILDLNENWFHEEVNKAKESLRRLKNPFIKDDGFKILVMDNTSLAPLEEYIESNIAEVLKDKSITIEAIFLEKINIKLYDRGEKIYELEADNDSLLKNCPIFLSINYLTTSAKSTFTKRMKVEPVNYGNIFIYKNNFRVMPYGEKDYDTFGLNLRKNQGYNRYLATRELMGFIEIKDHNNTYFKETSSRNSGFVNNIFLDQLESLYMNYIHRPLEAYMNLISWGEFEVDKNSKEIQVVYFDDINITETEKFKRYISRKKELKYFKNEISFDENKPEKKLEKIIHNISQKERKKVEPLIKEVKSQVEKLKKFSKEQERVLSNQSKNIEVLERQAKNLKVKRSEASYAEDLNHHLTLFSKRLSSVVDKLAALGLKVENLDVQKELKDRVRAIKRTADEMVVFRDILSKSDLDTKSPQSLNWIDLTNWRLTNSQYNIKVKLIDSTTNQDSWIVKSNVVEFILMIDNLVNNAEEHNSSYIEFEFNDICLQVKSDSTLIKEGYILKIFELGISTKTNGTGIGLNQVKKFLNKSAMNIQAFNLDDVVCFKIEKAL